MASKNRGDISEIKAPSEIPSEEPDDTAKKEQKFYQRGRGAGIRADMLHDQHIATLNGTITSHLSECQGLKAEVIELRLTLDAKSDVAKSFEIENVQLRDRVESMRLLDLWSNLFVIAGGALGAASSIPNLAEVLKTISASCGAVFGICGLLLMLVSRYIAKRPLQSAKKKSNTNEKPPA